MPWSLTASAPGAAAASVFDLPLVPSFGEEAGSAADSDDGDFDYEAALVGEHA